MQDHSPVPHAAPPVNREARAAGTARKALRTVPASLAMPASRAASVTASAVTEPLWQAPPRALVGGVRVLGDTVLLSLGLALASAPFSAVQSVGLVAALLLPAGLVAITTTTVLCGFAHRRWHTSETTARLRSVEAALVAMTSLLTLGAGGYLANVLLTDEPKGRLTCCGYLLAALAAGAVGTLSAGALRSALARRHCGSWSWGRIFTALLAVGGGGLLLADAALPPGDFFAVFHVALTAAALLLLACSLSLLRVRAGQPGLAAVSWPAGAGVLVLLLLVGPALRRTDGLADAAVAAARRPGLHGRAVLVARRILDRDGDGFSAALGGGDCDDGDRARFPLAPGGGDCLGGDRPPPPVAPALLPRTVEPPPSTILLLTADALRCGLADEERNELNGICPELARMAREGATRPDVFAIEPSTRPSVTGMQIYRGLPAAPRWLAALLREDGYRADAVITHPFASGEPGMAESYDAVDTSLHRRAMRPDGLTSAQVTALVLAKAASTAGERHFVWGHYYDAHAPYVLEPGSIWAADPLTAYVEEVRRVDTAIGLIAESARTGRLGEDVVVIVVADHGEEFGEHRGAHHGRTVYRESVRIPFVVWRTRAGRRVPIEGELPGSGREVAAFIASFVGHGRPAPATARHFSVPGASDDQYGMSEDGWTLIYHRRLNYDELFHDADDPRQEHDVAGEHPLRAGAMKAKLVASFHETARLVGPR